MKMPEVQLEGVKPIPTDEHGNSLDRQRPITYKMPTIPENATQVWFIDELGKFTNARKRIEKAEKFLKEAYKKRFPLLETVKGEVFEARMTSQTQMRISAELAREKLTPEQVAMITAPVVMVKLETKKIGEGWDDLTDAEIADL
jgi:hypothetical protein